MENAAKVLILLAFSAVLPYSPRSEALALSDVELHSHLNQPLSARIRLVDVASGELDALDVQVREIVDGDAAAGRRTRLRHRVVVDGAHYYLEISSSDSIREPILSFTVELSWPAGRLLRDYALIIDPQ